MWNTDKGVHKGKCIALHESIRKKGRSHIKDLSFDLNKLDIEEQIKINVRRRQGLMEIKEEINERETGNNKDNQ